MKIRNQLKILSKIYKVKFKIRKLPKDLYGYKGNKNSMVLNSLNTPRAMLSTFFHELGHIYCERNKLFPFYNNYYKIKRKDKNKFFDIAVKAEKWCDSFAKKEMKKYYPKMKGVWCYLGVNKLAIKLNLQEYYEST